MFGLGLIQAWFDAYYVDLGWFRDSLGLAYGLLGVYSGLVKSCFKVSFESYLKLFKVFWCLCRVGLGFILISFKTLWFRFRLGSIEGWLFVYLGLV